MDNSYWVLIRLDYRWETGGKRGKGDVMLV